MWVCSLSFALHLWGILWQPFQQQSRCNNTLSNYSTDIRSTVDTNNDPPLPSSLWGFCVTAPRCDCSICSFTLLYWEMMGGDVQLKRDQNRIKDWLTYSRTTNKTAASLSSFIVCQVINIDLLQLLCRVNRFAFRLNRLTDLFMLYSEIKALPVSVYFKLI